MSLAKSSLLLNDHQRYRRIHYKKMFPDVEYYDSMNVEVGLVMLVVDINYRIPWKILPHP